MNDRPSRTTPDHRTEVPPHGARTRARASRRSRRGRLGRGASSVHSFFTRELWSRELASLPTFRRWGYSFARVVHLTVVNFVRDRSSWRASALTYITVLALVPLLALAFSVAKGVGAYESLVNETIVPFLDRTFGPAEAAPTEVDREIAAAAEDVSDVEGDDGGDATATGDEPTGSVDAETDAGTDAGTGADTTATGGSDVDEQDGEAAPTEPPSEGIATDDQEVEGDAAEEVEAAAGDVEPAEDSGATQVTEIRKAIDTVLGFVSNTNVSRLGVFGFLIALWVVIRLLTAVEHSFNDIWGVQKARSFPRKLADYFSTIVLVPLMLVFGTGVLGMARSERIDRFLGLGGDSPTVAFLGSMVLVWLAFAFAYVIMPNTRVRITSALVGGIVGGTMWQLFQWAHVKLQIGVANYNAIYSTFAALPIFLFWIQSSWMTVLLGAEAAAAHQNQARHGQMVRSRDYDLALKEVVALRLVVRITRAFLAGAPPIGSDELAENLGCPARVLKEVAYELEQANVLASVEGDLDEPALVLSADPDLVRIQDVIDAMKGPSMRDESRADILAVDEDDAVVDSAFERFRDGRDGTAANLTMRELAEAPIGAAGGQPTRTAS